MVYATNCDYLGNACKFRIENRETNNTYYLQKSSDVLFGLLMNIFGSTLFISFRQISDQHFGRFAETWLKQVYVCKTKFLQIYGQENITQIVTRLSSRYASEGVSQQN